jgi:hypothetical protein
VPHPKQIAPPVVGDTLHPTKHPERHYRVVRIEPIGRGFEVKLEPINWRDMVILRPMSDVRKSWRYVSSESTGSNG